jgi:hypothetical protein
LLSATQTASRAIAYSTTQSYTISTGITVTTKVNSAITASITGGASWTSAWSITDTVTQQIPPKMYSWMEYTPNMNNSYGNVVETTYDTSTNPYTVVGTNSYFTSIYTAILLSGRPDGIYAIKESSVSPL